MLMCSANCYKDRSSPIEVVHSCAEKCNQKLEKGTNFFQRELDNMEVGITYCGLGAELSQYFWGPVVHYLNTSTFYTLYPNLPVS